MPAHDPIGNTPTASLPDAAPAPVAQKPGLWTPVPAPDQGWQPAPTPPAS